MEKNRKNAKHHLDMAIQLITGKGVPQNYDVAKTFLAYAMKEDSSYLPARYHYAMLVIRNLAVKDNPKDIPFQDAHKEIQRMADEEELDVARIAIASEITKDEEYGTVNYNMERERLIEAYIHASIALLHDDMQVKHEWDELKPDNDLYQNTLQSAKDSLAVCRLRMDAEDYLVAQDKVTKEHQRIMQKQNKA